MNYPYFCFFFITVFFSKRIFKNYLSHGKLWNMCVIHWVSRQLRVTRLSPLGLCALPSIWFFHTALRDYFSKSDILFFLLIISDLLLLPIIYILYNTDHWLKINNTNQTSSSEYQQQSWNIFSLNLKYTETMIITQ